MKTSAVNVRIEPALKHDAEAILDEIGLTPADAVRILYKQVCLHHGLPFELKIPSKDTFLAIEELEAGKGSKYSYFESLLGSI